jgi:hypothetical protein
MEPPRSFAPCRGFAISRLSHGSRHGLFSSALTSFDPKRRRDPTSIRRPKREQDAFVSNRLDRRVKKPPVEEAPPARAASGGGSGAARAVKEAS